MGSMVWLVVASVDVDVVLVSAEVDCDEGIEVLTTGNSVVMLMGGATVVVCTVVWFSASSAKESEKYVSIRAIKIVTY